MLFASGKRDSVNINCHVNKLDFLVGLAPSFTVQKVGLKLLRQGLVINPHFHKV